MHRLFWKIFFLFWIVNASVFTFGYFIANLYHDDSVSRYPIQKNAWRAVEAYENDELERFYTRNRGRKYPRHFLLDADNRLLPEGYLSSVPVPIVEEYPWHERVREGFKVTAVQAVEIESNGGEIYRFITKYNPHRSQGRPPFIFPLFLFAIAATSMFLAAYLTRPLRKLQAVVRRFASGEHDARVADREASRRDVVGEVGREFNVMAERLNAQLEAQRRLLRDVSHELRTPLARMQVAVAIAEDKAPGAEAPLARLHTEIERLDDLIGQVLALARIESGAGKLSKETLLLYELVNDIANDAEYEFSEQGKSVKLTLSETITITVDKVQMQSAIENVIRNAMRYTPAQGIVNVGAAVISGDHGLNDTNHFLRLTIRDHGPGVDEKNLPKLFNAFYREDDSRDLGSGGHGVGLAITRSIVTAHGGSVDAANHPRGGLEVNIVLPI